MRKTYGKIFAENPKLKVEIAKRIVQGEYVIDHEQVNTGAASSLLSRSTGSRTTKSSKFGS
jgi:hypothetical protein